RSSCSPHLRTRRPPWRSRPPMPRPSTTACLSRRACGDASHRTRPGAGPGVRATCTQARSKDEDRLLGATVAAVAGGDPEQRRLALGARLHTTAVARSARSHLGGEAGEERAEVDTDEIGGEL